LVAGVLMAFLLRLPEPLITFVIYDQLIEIISSGCERELILNQSKKIIQSLPDLNLLMLDHLIDFLDTMTRDSDGNLMTPGNLAICFGPGLMRRQEENLAQLMKESGMVTNMVTLLIEQYGFYFRVCFLSALIKQIIIVRITITITSFVPNQGEEIDTSAEDDGSATTKASFIDYTQFINVAVSGFQSASKQVSVVTYCCNYCAFSNLNI
jgi:hypothetical protein